MKGDTAFNEAFATTVELEGVRRWQAVRGDEQQRRAYEQSRQRQDAFVDLVTRARDRLKTIYAQDLVASEKQARKAAVQAELRQQYGQLKKQ